MTQENKHNFFHQDKNSINDNNLIKIYNHLICQTEDNDNLMTYYDDLMSYGLTTIGNSLVNNFFEIIYPKLAIGYQKKLLSMILDDRKNIFLDEDQTEILIIHTKPETLYEILKLMIKNITISVRTIELMIQYLDQISWLLLIDRLYTLYSYKLTFEIQEAIIRSIPPKKQISFFQSNKYYITLDVLKFILSNCLAEDKDYIIRIYIDMYPEVPIDNILK